jgi:hypothetical protein
MSFKGSLRMGDLGQRLFYEAFCDELEPIDGFTGDFKFRDSDVKLELKTDFYDMRKTPNFFIERFSSVEKESPGGPWQALEHGCKYYAYFYVNNLTLFIFDTEILTRELKKILKDFEPTHIKNKTWTTEGYRVPRARLNHIYEEVRLTLSKEAFSEDERSDDEIA